MNTANKITVARIFMIFGLLVLMLLSFPNKNYILTIVFIAISVTDILDGYVARKTKKVTAFGKVFDQIADKLLITLAFLYIITLQPSFYWMVFIILAREFLVSGFRMVAASYGVVVQAKTSGKIKMILQTLVIIYILLSFPAAYWALLVVTIYTSYTCIEYIIKIDKEIKQILKKKIKKK
ncbi:CDP-diacylglycerol--glycerol-3-phosphate 3-phosphatidyltransferase [Candidatus Woesearchaeota archaeon]|nr:MAG: CDP-diacylglycerol--glycerol-3-phosphate 3-phosphatidyltransferase [Candidatus Woesearchaeota archaeon]